MADSPRVVSPIPPAPPSAGETPQPPQPPQPQPQPEPPQPPLSPRSSSNRRDSVAREILESERTFVEQMSTLVAVFIKPLRWWQAEIAGSRESMHPPLPDLFLTEIFANIEQLLIFNRHVVEEFTEIHRTSKAFGAFFRKAAPFFKMYSAFVSNYDRAMETLIHLLETRLDFAAFVRACELQEGCKGLNLRAYLIMPVQRIPRYKLLLTELLKYTPEGHPDHADLVAAVSLVSGVVNSINEDIKRQEKRFKVMEVQARFDTPLVTASRKHERDGELIKMCRKGPKRFLFVLFNDLLIYGAQKLTSDKCSLHRKLDLGELFIVDSGPAEASFIVAAKAKSFVCQCRDLAEKKEWMAAFATCFAEMQRTVVYGAKHRVLRPDQRPPPSLSLWMVREGEMVRETYLMPELPWGQTYGFLDFGDLRLIVDPTATGPDRGSVGKRVMSRILRRGASLSQFNFKVQPEQPVPCEPVPVAQAEALALAAGGGDAGSDDESTYADALSPRSSSSASPVNWPLDGQGQSGSSGGGGGSGSTDSLGFPRQRAFASMGPRTSLSPDPTAPPQPQLNDAGFHTASGFVDGRMSGKWNSILTGLRPRAAGAATTPSPPSSQLQLLAAQGALQQHEMAQLEKSMAAMGLKRAEEGGGATAPTATAAPGAASQRKSPPPPLLQTATATATAPEAAQPAREDSGGSGITTTTNSSSKTPVPPPSKPASPRRHPPAPASPSQADTTTSSSTAVAASVAGPPPPVSWSASSLSSDSAVLRAGESLASQGSAGSGGGGSGTDSAGPSSRRNSGSGFRPVKAPRSPRGGGGSTPSPPPPTQSPPSPPLAPLPPPALAPTTSSTLAAQQVPGSEYTAVLPVCDFGLGLFLRDEPGTGVVIGGFRSPKHGGGGDAGAGAGGAAGGAAAVNPSARAGVRIGDVLLRVNNVAVSSVAHTIAVLRESRLEQVIALTLRRGNGPSGGGSGGSGGPMGGVMRLVNYSPPKPKSRGPSPTQPQGGGGGGGSR